MEILDHQLTTCQAWWTDSNHKNISLEKVPMHETWAALEEAVDIGIVKSIGVSNVSSQMLYDMRCYTRYPVSSLQIEHHPYLTQPDLISLAQELGIVVTAYSSFGPQSFLELPPDFRERAKGTPLLWDVEEVKLPAKRTGKSPAQVLLRWATQRGIAVIPKSNNMDRLRQNLDVNDFDLTGEEIDAISRLNKGLRFNDPGFYLHQPIRLFA